MTPPAKTGTGLPAPAPSEARKSLLGDLRVIWGRRKVVWGLVPRAYKMTFVGAVLVSAVVSLIDTGIVMLLGRFFDEIVKKQGATADTITRISSFYLVIVAVAYVAKEALQVVRRYLVHSTTTSIERDMTTRLVSHLLTIDLAALSRDRVGALHGRISRSVEGYVKFLKISFTDFLPAILTACFALTAAFVTDWRIGLVMFGVVPVSLFITVRQVISQKGIRMELLRAKEGLDGTVVEQLGGIEYIRAANTRRTEGARIATAAEARRGRELGHHRAMSLFDAYKSTNEGLFHLIVISFAIYLAASGTMDFGKVVAFSLLFGKVMGPLRDVHRILDEAYDSSIQVGVLMGMLEQPVDRSFATVTQRPPLLTGEAPLIVAQNLSVDYRSPDGTTRRALDSVNMVIRHGETIGAAGPSGSGKSTWLRAVLRLIHPSTGSVFVGGVPIDAVSREDIGKLIGYVSQVPFVFSGTVRENITYGVENATEADIEKAARQAHIHDEILGMPGGYDATLTERGNNLSGGQRQRIALARLFLRNPPILILDEGTSALDNISERKVQMAIAEARADRTVIMVAHRLSTLRDADRIFVFDAGRIVEEGSYDELLGRGGVFSELVHSAGDGNA